MHHNSKNKRSLQWTLLLRESGHCPPSAQSRKISRVMCVRASGRVIERLDSDGSAFTCGAFWDRDIAANGSDGASRPIVIGNSSGQLAVAYDHNKSYMHVDAHGDDPVVSLDTTASPLGSMEATWDASGFLISSGIQVTTIMQIVCEIFCACLNHMLQRVCTESISHNCAQDVKLWKIHSTTAAATAEEFCSVQPVRYALTSLMYHTHH